MKILPAVLSVVLLAPFTAKAVVPVEVIADASSEVGKVVTSVVNGKIAESEILRLTKSGEDRLQLRFLAMDQFGARPGVGTSYALSVTWSGVQAPMPLFFDQRLGYCGSDRIEEWPAEVVKILEDHAIAVDKARDRAGVR